MKRTFSKLKGVIIGLLISGLSPISSAHFLPQTLAANLDPHLMLGADLEQHRIRYVSNLGDNLFAERLNQVTPWGVLRLFRHFGIGGGVSHPSSKNRTTTLNEGDSYLGLVVEGGIEGHATETKISGGYVELVGFLPICPQRFTMPLDLFATFGMARNHLVYSDYLLSVDGVLLDEALIRSYNEHRTVARASGGVQVLLHRHFGIRAHLVWEDNSRFNNLKPGETPLTAQTSLSLKDSLIYGVGLFINL